MRIFVFAAIAAFLMAAPLVAQDAEQLSSRDLRNYLHTIQTKPGMDGSPIQRRTGDDSCRWANDGECDDPRYGTGACQQDTDYSDCWRIVQGVEDDSCQWANDGECDEPGFGTGACTQGTDLSDCGDVIGLRFRNDSCETAFNGVCEEPGLGNGACAERTDRADCIGRARPLTINDHFFGNDDRIFMDTSIMPWAAVGQVTFDAGGACTATLIGDDILITASHCVHDEGRLNAAGQFETGYDLPNGPRTARVIDVFISPEWDDARFSGTDEIDGTDWALLRIDQPLGRTIGQVGIRGLVDTVGERGALREPLYQGGYSWDTGAHLSGNIDCNMIEIFRDGTMAHDCDTTRGDSGSPFMVRDGNQYFVVATDSNFRSNPDGPFIYIAVRSEEWLRYYDDFAAGRVGASQAQPRGPGKPGISNAPSNPRPARPNQP